MDLEDVSRGYRRGKRQLRENVNLTLHLSLTNPRRFNRFCHVLFFEKKPLLSCLSLLALILAIIALIIGSLALQDAAKLVTSANIEAGAITASLIQDKAIHENHLSPDISFQTTGAIRASLVTADNLHLSSPLSLSTSNVEILTAGEIQLNGESIFIQERFSPKQQ